MVDNEITQKTIDLLDKIDLCMKHRYYAEREEYHLYEELKECARELRKMIEVAEIDKALMKGIK